MTELIKIKRSSIPWWKQSFFWVWESKIVAFRGHTDDSKNYSDSNPSNFQALLLYRISGGDKVLKRYFEPAAKNATV